MAEYVPHSFLTLPNSTTTTSMSTTTMSFTFSRLSRVPIRHVRYVSTPQRCPYSSIPTTPHCPSPTCACASAPPDLDIDRTTPLLNTMAAYSQQVILCTGKSDWHSNIEQEDGATGEFVKGMKSVIGKGAAGFDVCSFPFILIYERRWGISTNP
jgi:hypothetical protein